MKITITTTINEREAVKALLDANPHPTEEEARDFLLGNLCRCGTYKEVLAAVKELSE